MEHNPEVKREVRDEDMSSVKDEDMSSVRGEDMSSAGAPPADAMDSGVADWWSQDHQNLLEFAESTGGEAKKAAREDNEWTKTEQRKTQNLLSKPLSIQGRIDEEKE